MHATFWVMIRSKWNDERSEALFADRDHLARLLKRHPLGVDSLSSFTIRMTG